MITVAGFYAFAPLPDCSALRERLSRICVENDLRGILLLAEEGVNATLAGSSGGIGNLLSFLRSDSRFSDLEARISHCRKHPFSRLKIRLKREIVTMGVPGIEASNPSGERVSPSQWNDLIRDPGTALIDVRNFYEAKVGTFERSLNPLTSSFRDFPAWLRGNESRLREAKALAMFCTGGIRCEKAMAYARSRGFRDLFSLKGGVLGYLAETPVERSLWRGECFVFDARVSLKHGLEVGSWSPCHACRMPLSPLDRQSPDYEEGLSCPHCRDAITPKKRAGLLERRKQLALRAS